MLFFSLAWQTIIVEVSNIYAEIFRQSFDNKEIFGKLLSISENSGAKFLILLVVCGK